MDAGAEVLHAFLPCPPLSESSNPNHADQSLGKEAAGVSGKRTGTELRRPTAEDSDPVEAALLRVRVSGLVALFDP